MSFVLVAQMYLTARSMGLALHSGGLIAGNMRETLLRCLLSSPGLPLPSDTVLVGSHSLLTLPNGPANHNTSDSLFLILEPLQLIPDALFSTIETLKLNSGFLFLVPELLKLTPDSLFLILEPLELTLQSVVFFFSFS